MSVARVTPTSRGNNQDNPYSAGSPRRPCEVVSFAPAAAKRRSQKQARTRPTPAAGPLIMAMIGLGTPKWYAKSASNSGRTP